MRYLLYFSLFSTFIFAHLEENVFLDGSNRPTVTFIVDEDMEANNQYFAAAKKYYRTHDIDNQSITIDTCRSLQSIQYFLQTHPTKENKPWGKINIVAHGNEWTGLKLDIQPNVKQRLNTVNLKNALNNDVLPNLKRCRKIDRLTELHIQGCGVGKDVALLDMMQEAFGGRLKVYSPKKFVVYQPDNQCYMADNYYSFQHPDSSFNLQNAVRQLKKRYPHEGSGSATSVKLDWQKVLSSNNPTDAKSPFVYRFKIPIRWTLNYSDSTQVPKFPNPNGIQFEQWLFQQKELMATLEKTDLPKEAFRWVFDTEVANPETSRGGTMKILGICQVVCILKPNEEVAF